MNTSPSPPLLLPVFENLPGIRAFFTTRQGGESRGAYASLNLGPRSGEAPEIVSRNWNALLAHAGWGDRAMALPALCHGAARAEITEESSRFEYPKTGAFEPADVDAVFTLRRDWVLAVTMADCLPALIADPVSGCVAAVHAGWRGTRDGVLERTLEALFASGKCRPGSTHVVLGPCLSAPALEVGEDVGRTLPPEHVPREGGRWFFDLRGANRAQAARAGVPEDRITEKGGCTRENPELFYSYRRDGGVTGRMAACIALV